MDVVFLFISFWLAGPGPVRVDRATLECNSYMVSYAFGGFHWFLAGWPRPGPGRPGRLWMQLLYGFLMVVVFSS